MSTSQHMPEHDASRASTAIPGVPWEELFKALREQEQKSTNRAPGQSAVRLLQQAVRQYQTPICLKDLASMCGLGVPEASRSSKELEACGLAKRCAVAIGRTSIVFVEPTPEGLAFLGVALPGGGGRGGPGHRYCLNLVERHLQGKGYSATREVEVRGKRIDLLAVRGGTRAFVEVEMTDDNAARNATADLAVADASVKQIAVVCPTRKVLRMVEKAVRSAVPPHSLVRFAFKTVTEL